VSSFLKLEAVRTSETGLSMTTQRYIPEGDNMGIHLGENIKL
jgi:hypothetical protein